MPMNCNMNLCSGLVIALWFINTVTGQNERQDKCIQALDQPPCVCSIGNKTIDLRILAKKDGTP